nr:DUF962 domain-containing protein [Pseudomonas sp. PICF6]
MVVASDRSRLQSNRWSPRTNRTITTEPAVVENTRRFNTFAEFYPYYLSEHSNSTCRRLHFIGTSLVILIVALALIVGNGWWLIVLPIAGYGFAWVGHFFFEKNRPATFQHPFYSLLGDFVMYRDMLRGKVAF